VILQALDQYYNYLYSEKKVPPLGFSNENVSFVIVIEKDGSVLQVKDIRTLNDKNKLMPTKKVIPYSNQIGSRSAGIESNFIVDKPGYVLGGYNSESMKKLSEAKRIKAMQRHKDMFAEYKKVFYSVTSNISNEDCVKAMSGFLNSWAPENINELEDSTKLLENNTDFITFQINGKKSFVHEYKCIQDAWSNYFRESLSENFSRCMLTNKIMPIQRLHRQYKGLYGPPSTGRALASFNHKAFESYGKTQGGNSPISVEKEFNFSTALKYLLENNEQKMPIGETTTVFWTERESSFEAIFGQIVSGGRMSFSDNKEIADFLEAYKDGNKLPVVDSNMKFYILGLDVPNKARVSVRFWHMCDVSDMIFKLENFRNDFDIAKQYQNQKDLSVNQLLNATMNAKSRKEKARPLVAGALFNSIIQGTPYPQVFYSLVLNRIRAERTVSFLYAAILKAVLIRNFRKDITMALNETRTERAYLLGRLFALLEKVQENALGQINSNIRDKYIGSASATPANIFPRLLKLAQYHISKAKYGGVYQMRIGKIVSDVDNFPETLALQEQGLFYIGYYHQMNAPKDYWTNNKTNDNENKN